MAILHKELSYHVIFWALFIFIEVAAVYFGTGNLDSFLDYVGHYFINISFFYSTAFVMLPYAEKNRKAIPIGFALLSNFFFYFLLKAILITLLKRNHLNYYNPYKDITSFVALGIWRGLFFFVMATFYWFLKRYVNNLKEMHRLRLEAVEKEKQLLELELAKIQSQVNPHFIFNTVNFLYKKTSKASAEAGEAMLLWADILEYGFKKAGPDGKVLLKDELEQIRLLTEFIALVRSSPPTVTLKIEGDPGMMQVPPMLLVTFVENLIKHGDLWSTTDPASIHIRIGKEGLRFYTSNRKISRKPKHGFQSGLSVSRRRLALFYPEQFKLSIQDLEEHFIVELQIEL